MGAGLVLVSVFLLPHLLLVYEELSLRVALSGVLTLENFSAVSEVEKRQERIEALRVAWYRAALERDPFFALAGVDTEALRLATDALKRSEQTYLVASTEDARGELVGAMSPRGLLLLLPELEDARRAALRAPSLQSAAAYHGALAAVFDAYERDALRLDAALARQGAQEFNFAGGLSSAPHYRDTLAALIAEANTLEEEERARFACLEGTAPCGALPEVSEILPLTKGAPAASLAQAQAGAAFLLASGIYDLQPYTTASFIAGSEEIVHLASAACDAGRGEYFFSFESRDAATGIVSRKSLPSDDLYFLDTHQAPTSTAYGRYLNDLRARGLRWYSQPINLYLCPDIGPDVARVASVIALRNLAREEPLGPNSSDEVTAAERALADARVPDDVLAHTYASALYRAIAKKTLGASMEAEARERVLLWRGQTGGFEKIVGDAAILNEGLAYFASLELDVATTLLTRSYPSLFFLPFNRTVSGGHSFFISTRALGSMPPQFHAFWSDLSATLTLEELLPQVRLQASLSHRPSP